jgi:cytochrome b561
MSTQPNHVVQLAAKASHVLLYALMLVLPLLGWTMISASGEPVMLSSSL